MNITRIALITLVTVATATPALAQKTPSRFQVSLYPSSRIVATKGESAAQPRFKTYSPGASLTVAFGEHFALEGDVAASRGNMQSFGELGRVRSPAMVAGYINGVVQLAPTGNIQPYVTVGLGMMNLFKREALGMERSELLQSANVGGGVKVLFNGWGIRADYRFVGMDSANDERSTFFGPKTRYAHRMAVGLVLGGGR